MDRLKPGQSAVIQAVGGSGSLRHHLLDMGLTPQTEVTLQKTAPMGDPVQIKLRGYELTLRLDEARKIEIGAVYQKTGVETRPLRYQAIDHPAVGEQSTVETDHPKKTEGIPAGQPLRFALAGNQNCGKTTLFNQLTGANQHVGNFPGVTVDRKDGTIRSHPEATVTDLPGIYSLSPYSSEEIVTRRFLLETKPDGIINIVDATNIERNLYLTMQLMELGIPMVLALNMMDEVRANGGTVRVNELEQALGIPVVPISAVKNEGINELIDHAIHVARYREAPVRIDFCPDNPNQNDPLGAVHRCIHATAHMVENNAKAAGLPVRFAATKLIENDPIIEQALHLPEDKREAFEQIVSVMEKESGLDREAALANMRFSFLEDLCRTSVVRPRESKEHKRSMAIDRFLTGKYTAVPCFLGIMAVIFWMTFSGIGAWLSDGMAFLVNQAIALLDHGLQALHVNAVVHSLVIDGAAQGIGSVLSFLPAIVTLFFFLSILEDTGYMARVAFVMDRPAAEAGPLRPELCAHAGGLRLFCPGHYGDPDPLQRAGPADDHFADPLYELLGQAAHLYHAGGGLLPAAVPGAGHGRPVCLWDLVRHFVCRHLEADQVPGGAGALCHGAAQLPPAQRQERGAPDLGKGQGLFAKSIYRHLPGLHHHLVPADV